MYVVGLLFGLGFDTATEIALLAAAGTRSATGVPWYAILCLPILFAAGMSLLDTLDGTFMNFAYGWSLSQPLRKAYYNLTITGLSIAVAVIIGTVELLGLLRKTLGLHHGLVASIANVDLGVVGFIIVGLFVLSSGGSLLIWRYARVEQRCARRDGAPAPSEITVSSLTSATRTFRKENSMSALTNVAPVVLEPAAQEFAEATARPPYLFDLGPVEGRKTVDQAQSGQIDQARGRRSGHDHPGRPVRRGVDSDHAPAGLPRPAASDPLHARSRMGVRQRPHPRPTDPRATTGTGAAVAFTDYSLSPEARYPTAIEEIYAALTWVAGHGSEQDLDGSRIVVAGDSVGGNMTAAITLMAKQRSGPKLAAQVLFYPVTDASFDTDSYHQFATGYFLRRDAMEWFWDQYTTDENQRDEITASPLRATSDDLAGLPKALVITGRSGRAP